MQNLFIPDAASEPVTEPSFRERALTRLYEWRVERRREMEMFWRGTERLRDMVLVAFIHRIKRDEMEMIRQTPPAFFALQVGIAAGILGLLYAVKLDFPWHLVLYLCFQFYRLSCYLGSDYTAPERPRKSRPDEESY